MIDVFRWKKYQIMVSEAHGQYNVYVHFVEDLQKIRQVEAMLATFDDLQKCTLAKIGELIKLVSLKTPFSNYICFTKKGFGYLVRFNGQLRRAIAEKIGNLKVTVLLIDIGCRQNVCLDELFVLPTW